jgi:hypothetical protein
LALVAAFALLGGSGDEVGVSAAQGAAVPDAAPVPTSAAEPKLAILPENPTAEDFLESDWVRVVDQRGDERGVMNVAVIGTEANTWEIDLGDGFVGTAVYAPDTLEQVGVFVSGHVGFAELSEVAVPGRLKELDTCYGQLIARDIEGGPGLPSRCVQLLRDRGMSMSDLAEG